MVNQKVVECSVDNCPESTKEVNVCLGVVEGDALVKVHWQANCYRTSSATQFAAVMCTICLGCLVC